MIRFLNFITCLLGILNPLQAQVPVRTQDSLSLISLYNATGGANWTYPWTLSQPMTTWYGITLNANGCVTCIDLDGVNDCSYTQGAGNQLVGTLPSLTMSCLESLNLAYNQLSGTIPTLTLPALKTLDLRKNQFTGSIPNFNLPNLEGLYFNNNSLTGSIPNFNLPKLFTLYGMHNQLSGSIPNFDSTSLRYLYFDSNQLTGSVPDFKVQTLQDINFGHNQLTGSIPNFTLQTLTGIRLYNNKLTGSIPNFNLYGLEQIELQDNQLTGTIPTFISPNLKSLLLSNNQLTGSIPNFNYLYLEYLHLYGNRLTGSIPTFTLPNLKELSLYENQLTGTIPSFSMPNLLLLKLYNNQLTGSIPNFRMPLLTHMVLNTNQLSGTIPNFSMPNLVLLDLYKNQLSGDFPTGLSTILSTIKIDTNRFTFSNLIPNLTNLFTRSVTVLYAPQDSIFKDTTYSKRVGESLTIDLGIDTALTSSLYTWYKNGTYYDTTRVNKLIINGLQTSHTGTYTCKVTNTTAPVLALYSRKAVVTVTGTVSACRTQDSLALVDLYNATGGANWTTRTNWLTSNALETWYGVFVNAEGCVQKLILPTNKLAGSLPTTIGNFSKLEDLDLHDNALSGSIPNILGNLTNLTELYLHINQLTGSIPTELGNLTQLQSLALSQNSLTDSIPASLGNLRALKELLLQGNRLTGVIPTSLGNLAVLQRLSLFSNQLTGSIPKSLGDLKQLEVLYLYSNQLSGSLPTELGNLSNLTEFYLYGNQLTGNIPAELGNLAQLKFLSLNNNQLTGGIPTSLGNLRRLRELLLSGNTGLGGAVPSSLGNLDSLEILYLFSNGLTGAIPTTLSNLRQLKNLYLYDNQLSGAIPTNLGNLDSIRQIYIHKNQLTGAIPTSFQNALRLTELDFQQNKIDSVPNLSALNNLTIFHADANRLTFDDIEPNRSRGITYTLQDSIFKDTTYSKRVGDALKIDLGTDGAMTSNTYKWYKDDVLIFTGRANTFIINALQLSDAGKYRAEVSNADLPNLTLHTRKITLMVASLDCSTRDTTATAALCAGNTYRLPSGRTISTTGTYNDTLRSLSDATCDSIRYVIRVATDSSCRCSDSTALVTLYQATGGANWINRTNWLTTNALQTWYGVQMNALGCVDSLFLNDNRLTNALPDNIGNIANLKVFYLPNNQLTGSIPTSLGNLKQLTLLQIQKNQLTGSIPTSLGNLTALQSLYLNDNQLTGSIPISFGNLRQLQDLGLHNNQLTGSIPIEFGNLDSLRHLYLDSNRLTGNIPTELERLTRLQSLHLWNNQLTGRLPMNLSRTLTSLAFHQNQMDSLSQLLRYTNLTAFFAENNRLTFDDILPNVSNGIRYTPQDSIFRDTTIRANAGTNLVLSLGIDGALTTNLYSWFKNGTASRVANGNINQLILNNLQVADAGIYTCTVTNPNARLLTLYSRKITISVNPSGCPTARDTTATAALCAGNAYRLPSGRTISTAGTYNDTLRSLSDATCDSIRYVIRVATDSSCRCSDSTALVTLYQATGGTNWTNRTNWLSTNALQTWYGVRTDAQGCVDSIGLGNNNLVGRLSTLQMSKLSLLQLKNNQLTGNLSAVANLPNLGWLDLSYNQLDSLIPNLNGTDLKQLVLKNNRFSGAIPNFVLPNLQQLWLDSNALTGVLPLFNLPSLVYLGVSHNQLSGSVPNLTLQNLQELYLQSNRLTSIIPNFDMPSLTILQFQSNLIDSLSDLSFIPIGGRDAALQGMNLSQLKSEINRLTFDDILPNLAITDFTYAPQDSIFNATTYSKNVGDTLLIRLGIDGALTTNVYKWFKNGSPFPVADSTINQLVINGLQATDAGIYTCVVTNRNAPLLTLYSRKATVLITPVAPVVIPCQRRDSLALVDLYRRNAISTLARTNLTNWLTVRPMTEWAGLTISSAGCVITLDLSNIGLEDSLSKSIGNLKDLEELYLQNNNLEHALPDSLNQLAQLKQLLLSHNFLTRLPDSIWKLTNLRELDLDDNQILGNLPPELSHLTRLRLLKLSKNRFNGKIPNPWGNLTALQELTLSDNDLNDSIPFTLGRLPNLKKLFLDNNNFTGKIPNSFQQLRVLTELNFAANLIDSCPNLSALTNLIACNASANRLTFNDILPNLGHRFLLNYAPQDSIFRDTTYNRNAGESVTIDLGTDGETPNNVYTWFQNGVLDTTTTSNRLIINPLGSKDAGIYTCVVTNPTAPNLSLRSRKAVVNINCTTTLQERDTTICSGHFFTLPTGQLVTAAGTFRDTLRSRLFCDSIVVTRLVVRPRDTTRFQIQDCSVTQTQTDTTLFQNRLGCDSIVIRTRTARRDSIERGFQFTCVPSEVGIRILSRSTNQLGCDSIEYQRVMLAPSYRRDTTIWRCNQPDKIMDTLMKTVQGCDSMLRIHFRLCRTDSTIIKHSVCNSRQDSILKLRNFCGCDSTVTHKFQVLNLDTVIKTERVCNIAYVGTSSEFLQHSESPFCDSLVTITRRELDVCGCLQSQDSTQLYTGLIPNDDDNQNDFFIIPLLEQYTPNELVITDKRGMLVYRTLDYKNNWGGTNQKGEALPEGIYNFVFRTANPNCLRRGVIHIKYVP